MDFGMLGGLLKSLEDYLGTWAAKAAAWSVLFAVVCTCVVAPIGIALAWIHAAIQEEGGARFWLGAFAWFVYILVVSAVISVVSAKLTDRWFERKIRPRIEALEAKIEQLKKTAGVG